MNRKTGYLILSIGLGLLLFTFYLAIMAFLGPNYIQGFENLVQTNREGVAALVDVLIYLIPILLLSVMGAIGGKVMHYGVKLVKTQEPQKVVESKEEKTPPKRVKRTSSSREEKPAKSPPPKSESAETKGGAQKEPEKPTPPDPTEEE